MSNKDIFKRENRLAETLKTEHLQDWASHRILDYLMCRHENEPLGKPSQVELALWAELTKADQRIDELKAELAKREKCSMPIMRDCPTHGESARLKVAEAKLAEMERAALLTPEQDELLELMMNEVNHRWLIRPEDVLKLLAIISQLRAAKPQATEPSGVSLIAAEQDRQISVEGWTPEHDDEHDEGTLSAAASAYTLLACDQLADEHLDFKAAIEHRLNTAWPWDNEWWKPSPDPIRNLVKAGALIAAEIDRLQRLRPASAPCTEKEKL